MNENIAKALVKAQQEFGPALKSATNPHFRSKYADLSACVEAVIDALNANGVMLLQKNHPSEHGVSVETIFLHESGEEYSAGVLNVPATKLDAQGYGSALTYARRYSLMAACGIAPEDDDGNALRLAVKLKIDVCYDNNDEEQHVNAWPNRGLLGCSEFYGEDPYAATRRAIVRAAAEIGKAYASEEAPDANGASSLQQMESKEL